MDRKPTASLFCSTASRAALLTTVLCSAGSAVAQSDPFANLPPTVVLSGVVRDFKYYGSTGGHPDFERYSGRRAGLVKPTLDDDGRPVLQSTKGNTVTTEYKDRFGRYINPALYNASLGDVAGSMSSASTAVITSASSFSQWFRDVPGVNASMNKPVTLNRVPNTNIYRIQIEDNNATPAREGFFPVDNELYMDMDPTYHHNYSFTYELGMDFDYKRGTGQVFTFTGDDDVWVFIDGKMAIDLGGVHSAISQTIDIDRFADLHGLVDGQPYQLKFLYAERHTTRSNIRVETTIQMRAIPQPAVTCLFD